MSEKHTIYFAGRITGGRRYAGLYLRIVELLRTYGNVLTEHVANPTVEADEDNAGLTDVFIHDRDMDWLCNFFITIQSKSTTQPMYFPGRSLPIVATMF